MSRPFLAVFALAGFPPRRGLRPISAISVEDPRRKRRGFIDLWGMLGHLAFARFSDRAKEFSNRTGGVELKADGRALDGNAQAGETTIRSGGDGRKGQALNLPKSSGFTFLSHSSRLSIDCILRTTSST